MIKCENYLRYFKRYTDEFFCLVDPTQRMELELKIVHTLNVLKLMRRLAKSVNLKGEDYEIAKVIALFHDFGRFNQIKIYGHFCDRTSINHAEESVREMKRLNIIDKASDEYVPESKKEMIYKAILNHNKDTIDENDDEKTKMYSKLIRDCDKIDIYRSVEKYIAHIDYDKYKEVLHAYEDSHKVSDNVYNKIMKGQRLGIKDIKTIADNQIWEFYWPISDFNYKESLIILKEKGYYEKLFNALCDTKKFIYEGREKELYDYLKNKFYEKVSE